MARGDRPDPERDRRRQECEEKVARQNQIAKRVEQLVADATAHNHQRPADAMPDAIEIIERLEQARLLAMTLSEPQAAINAAIAQGKVAGAFIERAAVVTGTPADFETPQQRLERLSERYCSKWGARIMINRDPMCSTILHATRRLPKAVGPAMTSASPWHGPP